MLCQRYHLPQLPDRNSSILLSMYSVLRVKYEDQGLHHVDRDGGLYICFDAVLTPFFTMTLLRDLCFCF